MVVDPPTPCNLTDGMLYSAQDFTCAMNFLCASDTEPHVSILVSFFTKELPPLPVSTARFAIAVQISFPPAPITLLPFRCLVYLFSAMYTSLISN